jgi:DNA-binding transcriptional ArsR family regulator
LLATLDIRASLAILNHMVPKPIGSALPRDRLSATFGALADPTRRAILERLMSGEASVGELAEPFRMTTRAVSKHIAVLEAAGLVTRARDAQRRPSRIRAEPLAEVDEWLQVYRSLWLGRFRRLGARLQEQQLKKRKEPCS